VCHDKVVIWRNYWRRLADAMRGGMRQRVTRLGFAYSLATGLVGSAALLSANNLLFLLLGAMLATLIISGFLNRMSLAGLELELQLPGHITARSKTAARIRLRNEKTWLPSFSIHLAGVRNSICSSSMYFPLLPAGGRVEMPVEVTFHKRGLYTENSFQLQSRFPFGFAQRTVDLTLRRDVIVYPSLDPRPEIVELLADVRGEIDAFARGHGSDFYRIRPYIANESARHVDWRATAHTGDLQVREFAREQEPVVEIYLDTYIPAGGESWFEEAVEGCAYVCWQLARRGGRVRLRTSVWDRKLPEEADMYNMLEFLALVSPLVERKRLHPFGSPSEEHGILVVFTLSPRLAAGAGWHGAHLLDRATLARGATAARRV
jgi:uncharacterized protein (DUF58 family)